MLDTFRIAGPCLALASPVTVRGTVVSSDNVPIPAVKVTVSETAQTVETALDGTFAVTLNATPTRIHLLFERDGYYPSKRDLSPAEAADLRIVMTALKTVTEEVTVTASRMEIPLRVNPTSTTVVDSEVLDAVPRGIAADEALLTVPGVKVDNQADGERVHVSIRGQGILTERGIRGIEVLLDGIPLNDPSGFAPDLFDVDWMAVDRIEVLRGPVAFLYGGGSSGGIINIATREGGKDTLGGRLWTSGGSYGYSKVFGEAGGSSRNVNYHVTASAMRGDGYRDHTAFWANNVFGKAGWQVTPKLHLSAIVANTDYFNENAEGLNLTWLAQDRRMANPDALTYNEYQKTERQTFGITGRLDVTSRQALTFAAYFRNTAYTESVPSSVQHRGLDAPGFNLQYTARTGEGHLRNSFCLGADLDWQNIDEYRLPNLDTRRKARTVCRTRPRARTAWASSPRTVWRSVLGGPC